MARSLVSVREGLSRIAPEHAEAFLSLFPLHYYESFSDSDLILHGHHFSDILNGKPCGVIISRKKEDVVVTIIGADAGGSFAMLTGLLAASGMNIQTGDVYTSRADRRNDVHMSQRRARRMSFALKRQSIDERRVFIDHFIGIIQSDYDEWRAALADRLTSLLNGIVPDESSSIEQAARTVAEIVSNSLRQSPVLPPISLSPSMITIDNESPESTMISIISDDTPFFLYAFGLALSFHHVKIDHVNIRTENRLAHDHFAITTIDGNPITRDEKLNDLRFVALFTKQFAYFLQTAPDPYRALERYVLLIQDFQRLANSGNFANLMSSPTVLRDLARLLGTSDFLWEDFVRRQPDAILPLLSRESSGSYRSAEPDEVAERLRHKLSYAVNYENAKERLNQFKDNEIYLIDLDHILYHIDDFAFLSLRLTALAEAVANEALRLATAHISSQFGTPRSAAGMTARCAIMGLGKLGGAALGYASDIELLFVYSDIGMTDGDKPIENSEFFERVAAEVISLIEAKREGIFNVDTRLRPYGTSGPLACGFGDFVSYFRGDAVSLERLALVRLRFIAGSNTLGKRIEHARDELVYAAGTIDREELLALRKRQNQQALGAVHAKLSPGGLSDLEQCVQLLQVILGRDETALRTPRIQTALERLAQAGHIDYRDSLRLIEAYRFLRHLINGLRILRGNARDLYLPKSDSFEYLHLARRMGYESQQRVDPARTLYVLFETTTAYVRAFVERQLRRDLFERGIFSVVDIIYAPDPLESKIAEKCANFLSTYGFASPKRAMANLRAMAKRSDAHIFAEIAIIAWHQLCESPDPDMALNNWERFCEALDQPTNHYCQLRQQPARLDILIGILSVSQFLADSMIANPQFFDWVTSPQMIASAPGQKRLEQELHDLAGRDLFNDKEWPILIRRFRNRELLRIAARDICHRSPIQAVTADLSDLARAIISVTMERIWNMLAISQKEREDLARRFVILGFGKLGGYELNYSSDLDLVGVFEPRALRPQEAQYDQRNCDDEIMREQVICSEIMTRLQKELSSRDGYGAIYRIDLRLRPFGSSGILAHPSSVLFDYYRDSASLWEHQALMKASPVAGALRVGQKFLRRVLNVLRDGWQKDQIIENIERLRRIRSANGTMIRQGDNVKIDRGGLRDIEFLVQGLQMIYGKKDSALFEHNTINAIALLENSRIISPIVCERLRRHYLFLRRVEHYLQLLNDRQVHNLPIAAEQRQALARRMRQAETFQGDFFKELENVMRETRNDYEKYLIHHGKK